MVEARTEPIRPARRGTVARWLAGTALLLLLASCGAGKKSETGTFDYGGTWRGSVTDEANGAGTFLATLQQNEFSLTGTWHSVLSADPARQNGGTWAGQLFVGKDSDVLDVTLTPAVAGECSYKLTLSRNQDTLGGSYEPTSSSTGCATLTRGTLQVSKQR